MNIKEEIRKVLLKKKNEIFLNVLDKNINISYIDFYKNSSRVLNYFKNKKSILVQKLLYRWIIQ